ncbi:hypothetical protein CEW46_27660 [Bacillus cereus]|nr:hypothetical protein CEW46_27660 [Bacillus cereus]
MINYKFMNTESGDVKEWSSGTTNAEITKSHVRLGELVKDQLEEGYSTEVLSVKVTGEDKMIQFIKAKACLDYSIKLG